MALIHVDFYSQMLSGQTDFYAVIPNDVPPMMTEQNPYYQRPAKVVVLLHGFTGNGADWVTGTRIREYSQQYNLAILTPNGRNSFYLDREPTGEKYASYVGKELLAYAAQAFGLDIRPENCIIGGFSMGGFGAIHTGLMFDSYTKVIGLSNALIVKGIDRIMDNPMANLAYYRDIFGDLSKAEQSDHNPEVLLKKRLENGDPLPGFFLACGSEDFLFDANNDFDRFLTENGVAHEYHVTPGEHNWTFWNSQLEAALAWAAR